MELFTPDFGLIFWMFVSFAVLFILLWKFGWPVILNGIDSRADLIDKGVVKIKERNPDKALFIMLIRITSFYQLKICVVSNFSQEASEELVEDCFNTSPSASVEIL